METKQALHTMIKTMLKDLWSFCRKAKGYNPLLYLGIIALVLLGTLYVLVIFTKTLFTKNGFLMFVVGLIVGLVLGYFLSIYLQEIIEITI